MNKEELKNLINSLDFSKDEYYILGSGSLLLYGIREVAYDLDLCISEELFEVLKQQNRVSLTDKNDCDFYPIATNIEVVVNAKKDFDRDYVDGYPVERLEHILRFKESRNKPKDQLDIQKIKEYISK